MRTHSTHLLTRHTPRQASVASYRKRSIHPFQALAGCLFHRYTDFMQLPPRFRSGWIALLITCMFILEAFAGGTFLCDSKTKVISRMEGNVRELDRGDARRLAGKLWSLWQS